MIDSFWHSFRARTDDLRRDPTHPNRPRWLLIPGGTLALGSLGAVGWFGFQAWQVQPSPGFVFVNTRGWLIPYVLGVFVFLYGYELCDLRKALAWTPVVAVVGAAALVAILAVIVLLEGELPFGDADLSHVGGGHGGGSFDSSHGGSGSHSGAGASHGGGGSASHDAGSTAHETNDGYGGDGLDGLGDLFHAVRGKKRRSRR